MILPLITSLLKLAVAYFELKNKSFYYDILEKSRTKCNQLAEEIEKLRAEGTQFSTDRADVLFMRLKSEQKYAEHLAAQYSKTEGGN
jgi:predicted nuclease of restriction endonuclease-like (RecB) superfamily